VLRPLWYGIRQHRGKGLAAFLKAIGFIIPLMDAEYASYYTKEVMVILIREFASPDEEMKKIVLKVDPAGAAPPRAWRRRTCAHEILPRVLHALLGGAARRSTSRNYQASWSRRLLELAAKVGGGGGGWRHCSRRASSGRVGAVPPAW
jgi:splicing factor 3B subunit 1